MPNEDAVEPVTIPRGVADSAGETGYVVNTAGGIDAVELASGRRRWTTSEALRPLLVDDGRLVAYRAGRERPNTIRVVVLDAAGETLLTSDEIAFPEWLSVAEARHDDFRVEARVAARVLVLEWRGAARYRGGAPPPEQVVRRQSGDASGTVRIDLETGAVAPPAGPRLRSRAAGAPARRPSAPYQVGFAWHRQAWTAGDKLAALEVDASDPRGPLFLRTWSRASGEDLERRLLVAGGALSSALAPGGRYLFVHRPAEEPTGESVWLCFDVESGSLVAELGPEAGLQSPAVAGSRIFYLASDDSGPRSRPVLVARDLATGDLLWRQPFESALPPRLPPGMSAGPAPGRRPSAPASGRRPSKPPAGGPRR